ncbi:MAG: FAD-binding protein [Planctomycetia bacterium]|nr:FAD-binding protein [Planctomycetia bacterium]
MKTIKVHTLVVGSGAAGLATALQLRKNGVEDVLIATESLDGGTSINTGSDKQTYYKLSLCGRERDSVRDMAQTYFQAGGMHGDHALIEAANSTQAFMNLVQLGIPFPTDDFGQFVGYKTDHDPMQRATSIGPYTSREMCRAMIHEVRRQSIPVWENLYLKELLIKYAPTDGISPEKTDKPRRGRVVGALFFSNSNDWVSIRAQNVVLCTGGPGGLYKTSVYPKVHLGAIGVALKAGAAAQNLPESQFGLASTKFRWNVSGSYMQCIPRFISTAQDGASDEREFLPDFESFPGESLQLTFLKGYQWPFDARKLQKGGKFGSSMVDIWVYIETEIKGRRVWLDFRQNPRGFARETLGDEALRYLENCGVARLQTPIARLEGMNPAAIKMYAEHGIDIAHEPLEIAVCAQHNNGGLAIDAHWESLNIERLFAVGEVAGTHGVYRPGGSALNAGQVGAIRAAKCIAQKPALEYETTTPEIFPLQNVEECEWRETRETLQERMSQFGGFIRRQAPILEALRDTQAQLEKNRAFNMESHRNEHLLVAQKCYLSAINYQISSGVGSRGSAIVLDEAKEAAPDLIMDGMGWRVLPEKDDFRDYVLETWLDSELEAHHRWTQRRQIPDADAWFETVWNKQRAE